MAGIDHLVLGTSRLEDGVAWVNAVTGVEPAAGGRHVHLGTHNALLSFAIAATSRSLHQTLLNTN